jgi:hypothetical protein
MEIKRRFLFEELKMWLQPELYSRMVETERNKRVNVDFPGNNIEVIKWPMPGKS